MNEQILMKYVEDGEFEIDEQGRIWRLLVRRGHKSGGVRFDPVIPRRRAEQSAGRYLQVTHRIGDKRIHVSAHRLVWQYLFGVIPKGMEINHKNGVKTDNRPENLEVVTPSENALHAHKLGLAAARKGSACNLSKLQEDQVIEIRRLYHSKQYNQAELGRMFGISGSQIGMIVRGKSWSHIGGPIVDRNSRYVRKG